MYRFYYTGVLAMFNSFNGLIVQWNIVFFPSVTNDYGSRCFISPEVSSIPLMYVRYFHIELFPELKKKILSSETSYVSLVYKIPMSY